MEGYIFEMFEALKSEKFSLVLYKFIYFWYNWWFRKKQVTGNIRFSKIVRGIVKYGA